MTQRALRLVLAILTLVPTLACGLIDTLQERPFVSECTDACAVGGVDRTLCADYCTCGYRYASDNDRLAELENAQATPGQPMPPVLVDLMAECGSDVWDASFTSSCMQSCEIGQEACRTHCACFLGELRGTGDRRASTRFLVENLEGQPTEAGNQRMQAAERVCLSGGDAAQPR